MAAGGIAGVVAMAAGLAIAGIAAQSHPEGKAKGLVYRSSTEYFAGSGGAAAACPQGKHVSGGGAAFDGATADAWIGGLAPDYVSLDISTKHGYSTRASVSGLGQHIKVVAICGEPGDLVYRKRKFTFTTSGDPVQLKAHCPAGTHVTGGGLYNGASDDDFLVSAPYDGNDQDSKPDDGWVGRIVPASTAKDVFVRAICSDAYQLSYHDDDVNGTGVMGKSVVCPAGSAVTGGGMALSGDAGAYPHASQPADIGDVNTTPEDGWLAEVSVTGTRTLTVIAICKS